MVLRIHPTCICLRRLADLHLNPATGKVTAVSVLRDALRAEAKSDSTYYATYLYITFMHNFLSIFHLTDLTLHEAIFRAGWCIAFLGHWETSVRKSGVGDVKTHCLTRETVADLIIACNGVILFTVLMRDFCFKNKVLLWVKGQVEDRI